MQFSNYHRYYAMYVWKPLEVVHNFSSVPHFLCSGLAQQTDIFKTNVSHLTIQKVDDGPYGNDLENSAYFHLYYVLILPCVLKYRVITDDSMGFKSYNFQVMHCICSS